MNKAQLINSVAEKNNLSKKDAALAVNAVTTAIIDALTAGENVQILGFGNFAVKTREARDCRNPRTGETVTVPASKRPVFAAGKAFKDAVNK